MRKVYIWAVALVILPCLLPTAYAYDDSVHILLFVKDPEDGYRYDIGDPVPVKVMFFDKGQLIDADNNPTIILNQYSTNHREVNTTKISDGEYEGNITILESDVNENYIQIIAEATLGRENESDLFYDEDSEQDGIMVSNVGRLSLQIIFDYADSSHISATPGDSIYITVIVENNSEKINPDSFKLSADNELIDHTNPSIGEFKATYTISSELNKSTSIGFKAEVEHDNYTREEEGQITINFWNIWYHRVNVNETLAQFELCVADGEGKAISGADIAFNFEIDDYYVSHNSPSKSVSSDSRGKSSFSIYHDARSFIQIRGSAEKSGKIQKFDYKIPISFGEDGFAKDVPSPDHDFQVIHQNTVGKIEIGEHVSLEYAAYSRANPLPDQMIYYYLYDDEKFIKSGWTTTNSSGIFNVNLTVPETGYTIEATFESPFENEYLWEHADNDDDLVYKHDWDFISVYHEIDAVKEPDESIIIEVDNITIGGKTTVKASCPDSEDYNVDMWLIVGNYTLEDYQPDLNHEWEPLISVVPYPSSYNYPLFDEGKYIWVFYNEEFLPLNETYTVFVIFRDESGLDDGFYYNYVHIKSVKNVKEENSEQNILFQSPFNIGGIGISWLSIIIIIIIIMVLIATIKRRRTKAKPPPSNQLGLSSAESTSQQVEEQSNPPKTQKPK